jgi:hypothetical protein
MATVKGSTQNKRKREPNESTRNMSRELYKALISLFRNETTSIMEEVNVLIGNYTEKDVQEALLEKEDRRGRLPIHLACEGGIPVEVIRLLLENDSDKETIFEKDGYGQLPIHYACEEGAPVEVVQLLLDSDDDKKSIFEKNDFGRVPIHYACVKNAPVAVIQLLLDSDTEKKSILEKDQRGRLPIHLACGEGVPVEAVQLLLQASICDRIDQLGLQQWKIDVEELINAMTADASKTRKVQEIYERLSKYEEIEHTMSLLALAIWRTSCLHWGDIKFQSMQEIEDLQATYVAAYKRERRIKSGADVVIRGVLPFLPVDDDDSNSESSSSNDDSGI